MPNRKPGSGSVSAGQPDSANLKLMISQSAWGVCSDKNGRFQEIMVMAGKLDGKTHRQVDKGYSIRQSVHFERPHTNNPSTYPSSGAAVQLQPTLKQGVTCESKIIRQHEAYCSARSDQQKFLSGTGNRSI